MMFEHADGNPVLELDDEQSWRLLEGTRHGRLVVSVAGEPDIFPVNYVSSNGKLYLRTAPGNKLAQLTINASVLFEADGILSDEAWSVVLRGKARVLSNSAELAAVEELGLKSWVANAQGLLRGNRPRLGERAPFPARRPAGARFLGI
jgi:nitroimidazol reductase NimA-like FMN-containing flavoprotein (pyridoxamine 5'-phosphate oxidase superfamily)